MFNIYFILAKRMKNNTIYRNVSKKIFLHNKSSYEATYAITINRHTATREVAHNTQYK